MSGTPTSSQISMRRRPPDPAGANEPNKPSGVRDLPSVEGRKITPEAVLRSPACCGPMGLEQVRPCGAGRTIETVRLYSMVREQAAAESLLQRRGRRGARGPRWNSGRASFFWKSQAPDAAKTFCRRPAPPLKTGAVAGWGRVCRKQRAEVGRQPLDPGRQSFCDGSAIQSQHVEGPAATFDPLFEQSARQTACTGRRLRDWIVRVGPAA
jgi:hypothetical protein